MDDWLTTLQRAAQWNGWDLDELLIQLAGHLNGRAVQEWNLTPAAERRSYETSVASLCSRLDPGNRAMAVQDFSHASQRERESASDFVSRLGKIFSLAYGHDQMLHETRDKLLYSQLQERLKYSLMEAPAVSSPIRYQSLCVAAKIEGRRQAELKKRRQYKPDYRNQFRQWARQKGAE